MTNIEYRSANGRKLALVDGRLVVAASVHSVDISANLRANGCPENLIERHEMRSRAAAAMRRGTTPEPTFAELKAKAAAIGAQIKADNQKYFGK